jgi:hypothetical protein
MIARGVFETDYLKRLRNEYVDMDLLTEQFAIRLDHLADQEASLPTILQKVDAFVAMQKLQMAEEESQFLPLVLLGTRLG